MLLLSLAARHVLPQVSWELIWLQLRFRPGALVCCKLGTTITTMASLAAAGAAAQPQEITAAGQ